MLHPPRRKSKQHSGYLEHFTARVLTDALNEATADYWRRRAQAFRAAAPKPRDLPGKTTLQELAEAGRRCLETAKACEHRADLIDQWRCEGVSEERCKWPNTPRSAWREGSL
jgi:hypothetical protein